MIISEIKIRGFRSFGANEQSLKLNTEGGDLILLMGSNGAGKSSLINSFDYTLFGQVRGRNRKKMTLSTIPNRINKEMLNSISFRANNIDIEVKRGINPNLLELWENGELCTRFGKANLDTEIQRHIGMSNDTFKSFISMSVNDFKNFISLSSEDKEILLDKLFNLEILNILSDINKNLIKNNKNRISILQAEISTIERSIDSIEMSLKKSLEREKANLDIEINELKKQLHSKKEEYQKLKENTEKGKTIVKSCRDEVDAEKKKYNDIQNDIRNVEKEINLFNNKKCPTCGNDFTTNNYEELKKTLNKKKEKLLETQNIIKENVLKLQENEEKMSNKLDRVTKLFNEMYAYLSNINSQIKTLEAKKSNESDLKSTDIEEFENTLREMKLNREKSKDEQDIVLQKETYYKELGKILGENGVRKNIIMGIIKPINHYIAENLRILSSNFEVELDETFTAKIRHLGDEIDHETLSTGETRKINIAILIAYLKLIRANKHVNVLFLDEVFSNIDIEGVEQILNLLKNFANEYKINIFVVHHALVNEELFDRIIKIQKDVFSYMEEIKNN